MSKRTERLRTDDLRGGYDPDDDEVVRDALEDAHRRRPDPSEPVLLVPLRPLIDGEVVCRHCHLIVRRPLPPGVALLVCDDCRY